MTVIALETSQMILDAEYLQISKCSVHVFNTHVVKLKIKESVILSVKILVSFLRDEFSQNELIMALKKVIYIIIQKWQDLQKHLDKKLDGEEKRK